MRSTTRFSFRFLASTLLALAVSLSATAQAPAAEAADINTMMQKSADDWNRGDLDAFATCYKNSPEIEFIGATISHGHAGMLATYKAHYPTKEAMGTLSFSQLDVKPLDAHFATVTGWFHLERTAAGGDSADGYFLLVTEKTPTGWKIVRDATTVHAPLKK
jgi:ketosteroid isomerase-like protein